ncbi:hypothetical protein SETIT_1G170100v2 [Setaria italica]|uniref:CCHC-type domain-containing protein n=1 Tax=Setaria italica TaxID=4555 RepID=K3YYQ7_SETIT|nr:hypothetical protein SETIT_1G170100v2 [Setaria italica]
MANKKFDELALDGTTTQLGLQTLKLTLLLQKELICPLANHEWNHLCLQDFKNVVDYNHVIHSICSKLKFCEKKPTNAEKIDNFQQYSQLIHTLSQAEKYHVLLLKNAHQCPPDSAPLPEVHYNVHNNADNKKEFKGNNFSRNSEGKHKFNNRRKLHKRGKGKGTAPPPHGNSRKHCNRCGRNNHVAKECHCPPHLVLLYQKSLKKAKFDKPRYKAHFNLSEATPEVATSQQNPVATAGILTLP